jgi:hypothetical protein
MEAMRPDAAGCALDPGVLQALRRLHVSLRLRLALRGLGWTLAAALGAAWVSFLVDYGLHRLTVRHLPLGPRLVVDGLCLAAVGLVAWRRLLRAVGRRYSDADMAALVERGHAELQDRLLSAVHFTRGAGARHGASAELVRKVVAEANAAARAVRLVVIVGWRRRLARPLAERARAQSI